MTSSHFIFIPAVLVVGFFIGFLFAKQGAQDQVNRELAKDRERAEARGRREAKRAARKSAKGEK